MSELARVALVALGGGAGAAARYVVGRAVQAAVPGGFPWGTLAVNSLGCLLFGAIFAGLVPRTDAAARWHLLLTTGVLGGFTTFSTFSQETVELVRAGESRAAAFNVALSLGLCLAATFVGGALVNRLR